jgi:hypothetical protein
MAQDAAPRGVDARVAGSEDKTRAKKSKTNAAKTWRRFKHESDRHRTEDRLLASRRSECDEGHRVIQMRRHLPQGPIRPIVRVAENNRPISMAERLSANAAYHFSFVRKCLR